MFSIWSRPPRFSPSVINPLIALYPALIVQICSEPRFVACRQKSFVFATPFATVGGMQFRVCQTKGPNV
ncbi:hypothetical protein ZHAS_00017686 [Anopheles sinensis]|uniref:Uncharacterized protein n=1 Tax=Anopheles sinensis TaxID=74873 RepID=A0A084WGZ1_ANOSI|nr:hypothetical protein ZHAS_00017686 [Anopheles sinensis]